MAGEVSKRPPTDPFAKLASPLISLTRLSNFYPFGVICEKNKSYLRERGKGMVWGGGRDDGRRRPADGERGVIRVDDLPLGPPLLALTLSLLDGSLSVILVSDWSSEFPHCR